MAILLPENLMESVNKVAEVAIVPPAQAVGKTFSDLWFLVFGGISQVADKRKIKYKHGLEAFSNLLEEKLSAIPDDRKVEPNTQIVAQALENSKFCVEDSELRELFSALIASACDSSKSSNVHPSFAEIIRQLSPIEAKLLEFVIQMGTPKIPSLSLRCTNSKESFFLIRNYTIFDGNNYFGKYEIKTRQTCYDNFERLGLIKIYETIPIQDVNSIYKDLEEQLENIKLNAGLNEMFDEMKFVRGHYLITDYGDIFAKCCMTPVDIKILDNYVEEKYK